ncbi:MAG: hypothetical protein A2W23_04705 [Planctomycetes bacterium RBG_16_43_13]|nr:MAG: hypothetical protein A2W23_04705 [Planctomycetes bacterium RBG_16_43_13]
MVTSKRIGREKGVALLMATVVVVIAIGLGGALLASSYAKSRTSTRSDELNQAQFIAEAGLEKARRVLYINKSNSWWLWSGPGGILDWNQQNGTTNADVIKQDFLTNFNNGNYNLDIQNADQWAGQYTWDGVNFCSNLNFYNGGSYYVYVANNNDGGGATNDIDGELVVTVTSTLPDGTQRQIEARTTYSDPLYMPDAAIVADGSFKINGAPTIDGAKGEIMTNGDLYINGNPSISVSGDAAGQVILAGNPPTPPGGWNSGVPQVPLPEIKPWEYASYADYFLTWGYVYDKNWGLIADLSGGGSWNGFNWNSGAGEWGLQASSATIPAAYYTYNTTRINGSGGKAAPATLSIISTGSIVMTGGVAVQPYLTNTLFIAGGDIHIGGNGNSTTYNGLLAAHEQMKMAGTPDLLGSLLAEDAVDFYSEVTTGSTIELGGEMAGNSHLTYNGGMTTILKSGSGSVAIKALRQLK